MAAPGPFACPGSTAHYLRENRQYCAVVIIQKSAVRHVVNAVRGSGYKAAAALLAPHHTCLGQVAQRPLHGAHAQAHGSSEVGLGRQAIASSPVPRVDAVEDGQAQLRVLGQRVTILCNALHGSDKLAQLCGIGGRFGFHGFLMSTFDNSKYYRVL